MQKSKFWDRIFAKIVLNYETIFGRKCAKFLESIENNCWYELMTHISDVLVRNLGYKKET